MRTKQIDLFSILTSMRRIFLLHWLRCILLFLVLSAGCTVFQAVSFKPQYESYVTYAVSTGSNNNTSDVALASRISNSFSYLLWSNGVYQRFYQELGLTTEDENLLPVTIKATCLEETNFLTIKAVSENAVQANQAIEFVVREFKELVNIIVGNIQYTIVEQTGLTDTLVNPFSWLRFILMGVLFGGFTVVAGLFLLGYTSEAVRSYEDIRDYLNVPQIGGIPQIKLKRRQTVNNSLVSIANERISWEFKEAFYQIRSRIEKEMQDKQKHILLISSSVAGEGKTTISANLAISIAERGVKVLIIDCDLRNPSLAGVMAQKEIPYGIGDVLDGTAALDQAIIHLGEKQPDLLCGKEAKGETGKYLVSEKMHNLIQTAAKQYDYVLLDTPPSAMLTDASILARYAEAIVYVVRQDYTRVKNIEEGINNLGHSNVEMFGFIFNCVENNNSRYGGRRYGYGKAHYRRTNERVNVRERRSESGESWPFSTHDR